MPRGENRERMLEKGFELFYENGFESTGVQEITGSCGVPKGSFYYYFDSKDDFGLSVLEQYVDVSRAHLIANLVEADGTPLERLQKLFADWTDALEERGFTGGCLAGNLCQELAARSPEFQSALGGWFDQLQTHFADCIQEAQAEGEVAASEDPDALAEFVYNGWQGALLRMKAAKQRRPLDEFRRLLFEKVLR